MSELHNGAIVENRFRFTSPALSLKSVHPPGKQFNYSTVETGVLGWVVERAVSIISFIYPETSAALIFDRNAPASGEIWCLMRSRITDTVASRPLTFNVMGITFY
jgi:hypothetical protein